MFRTFTTGSKLMRLKLRLFAEAAIAAATIEASIREVNARVAAQQDRWERMQGVIDERAQDPDHQVAPGGSTGLLVREVRVRPTTRTSWR